GLPLAAGGALPAAAVDVALAPVLDRVPAGRPLALTLGAGAHRAVPGGGALRPHVALRRAGGAAVGVGLVAVEDAVAAGRGLAALSVPRPPPPVPPRPARPSAPPPPAGPRRSPRRSRPRSARGPSTRRGDRRPRSRRRRSRSPCPPCSSSGRRTSCRSCRRS